jgi:hypothetical protein
MIIKEFQTTVHLGVKKLDPLGADCERLQRPGIEPTPPAHTQSSSLCTELLRNPIPYYLGHLKCTQTFLAQ